MGVFENVDFKFFVKGHTKNSCDRDFRHNRKYMDTAECWTMAHVIEAVNAAASNAVTGHVPRGSELFKSCKPELTELYKRLDGAQKYQIFSIDSAKPGVVAYKKGPDSDAEEQDLRRKLDGILTAKEKVSHGTLSKENKTNSTTRVFPRPSRSRRQQVEDNQARLQD
ncbi:hypothetical protein PR003_g17430 [Phytophthora rubi]|uniref:DUF7869 domain-containing protein n=1 Tax=Phytophthora rubi TaxID=129364 RepID=A0A6A4EFF5_9STRA|nr:hypothetical protein PR003_g17430 [Phytophthora rubi]